MNKLIVPFLITTLMAGTAAAQVGAPLSGGKEPVEISAGKTLEWHQKDKQYVADGDVEAKQGNVTIFADKMIADYRDEGKDGGGSTDVWQLTALNNVTINNLDSTATGDKGIYNVDTGVATLTGNNLKLITPEQIITAAEKMEYDTVKGEAKAIGAAKIIRADDTLSAQTITAYFEKNDKGKDALTHATAIGGVTITTPTEILTGDNGYYNATSNTAEVKGNVKIVRGPNQLEGARAEVNLATNISKMFGAPESGKRVKGIFFPGSK